VHFEVKFQGFDSLNASVSTSGSSVRLGFLNPDRSIGTRICLFDETAGTYATFKVLNKEFTFDVDTSQVPCAVNGALYFSEMDADGGMALPRQQGGREMRHRLLRCAVPEGRPVHRRPREHRTQVRQLLLRVDIWEGNIGGEQMAVLQGRRQHTR
jgi:cellulose 1,4-beta-cellobiosidase